MPSYNTYFSNVLTLLFEDILFQQAVVRGGISVSAVFNYQLTPELSTKVCYTDFRVRTKNCLGVYHQWTNNKINLDVWYQWRSLKWCRTSWGNIPYVS